MEPAGVEVIRLMLGHGEDPVALLASRGWEVTGVRDVVSDTAAEHLLTMSFEVQRSLAGAAPPAEVAAKPRPDNDLVISEGEVAHPYQRVAAYALVTSRRGVLMTQFSDQTNAGGQWGLPGGGIDVGEAPDRAVLREVWEESGQVVEVGRLALVRTGHWIGRSPGGRLEDFHAVRLIYRAWCPAPTEPVVHDVGGTTASAAWVPPDEVGRLEVAASWRWLISGVVMAPDEADGPQHHQNETDADDRARPEL